MIHNVDPQLSQWDVGRTVSISDSDATHIHFANQGDSKAVIIKIENGSAKIPDYLLQTGKMIVAYAVEDGVTLESKSFPVRKRERPENYIYEEDQRNFIYELICSAEQATKDAQEIAVELETALSRVRTEEGGEIFNDYENNRAAGRYAHVEGSNNETNIDAAHIEGHKCGGIIKGFHLLSMSIFIGRYDKTKGVFKEEWDTTITYLDADKGNYVRAKLDIAINGQVITIEVVNIYDAQEIIQKINEQVELENDDSYGLKLRFGLDSIQGIVADMTYNYIYPVDHEKVRYGKIRQVVNTAEHPNTVYVDGECAQIHANITKYGLVFPHTATTFAGNLVIDGGRIGTFEIEGAEYMSAHAEGVKNFATIGAHAEGSETWALAFASHTEGRWTEASGDGSHAEGAATKATGHQSHAEGELTIASGYGSHAEGMICEASGSGSHAEGHHSVATEYGSHAEGYSTSAGKFAHAEGFETKATARAAHSEGTGTQATETYAHAEGQETLASGRAAHAEGHGAKATSTASHAEGGNTEASGYHSHAEGTNSIASGEDSHAQGRNAKAEGQGSHAEGIFTISKGYGSHAEGRNTTASAEGSHAEGIETNATGIGAHAEGRGTGAGGGYAHAEGQGARATGAISHAEGHNTTASGESSHAQNRNTTASGRFCHAEGLGTKAASDAQHVQGKYNIEDTAGKYAHIVGNGNASVPSNGHTIDWNGLGWFKGGLKVGGMNQDDARSVALLDANGKLPLDLIPDKVKAEIAQMVLALLANGN